MNTAIEARLEHGLATSKQLQAATGMSQSSVSRRLRELGNAVVRVQRGRDTLYALKVNAFGAGGDIPLYQVDPHGNDVLLAVVSPLAHGGYVVAPVSGAGASRLFGGERGDGLFDDLPYFLADLRPQGYIGRRIAQELAARDTRFPGNPEQWNSEHIGRYLLARGDDLPGNLLFGDAVHLRPRYAPSAVAEADYPMLAEAVLEGRPPGSSAGGEQPKFTAYRAERGHVIVKFSPPGDDPVARRWRDILITEHHAAQTLRRAHLPSVDTDLFEMGGRLFLESPRFDRSGPFGRLSMISLQAVDAEFVGQGGDWSAVVAGLVEQGLVSQQALQEVRVLSAFGRLIHNTDMHPGNLSLAIDGDAFRLLPVYDMCAMGFAPQTGEARPPAFSPPDPDTLGLTPQATELVRELAGLFWESVYADAYLSEEMRGFLMQSALWNVARQF